MGQKSLRELRIKAKSEGLKEAASEAELLDNKLNDLFLTVALADKYLGRLEKAAIPLAKNMKAVNAALKTSKPQTKSLTSYIEKMFDVNDTLELVENQAIRTASALGKVDTKNIDFGPTNKSAGRLESLLDEIANSSFDTAQAIEALGDETHKTNIFLESMWETSNSAADAMDNVEKHMRRAGKATKKTGRSVDKTNNSLRRMNSTGSSTTRGLGEMMGQMNPLTSAYASIAINVYALSEAFRVVNEAANLNRLVDQMSTFSAAVSGLDVASIAAEMRELAAGTLSVSESMQFATKGVAFNFTTEQLANLTRGAKKASIALGRDFTESMDRVLRGISKQEIELFDELGVVTRLTPAFQKYAGAVGKTVDQLTDYERQVALTNEVQKQLDDKFSGIDIAATGWERLGVSTKNSVDAGLRYIAEVAEPVADFIADLLESGDRIREATSIGDKPAAQAETFIKAFNAGNIGQAISATGDLTREIKKLGEASEKNRKEAELASNAIQNSLENGNLIDMYTVSLKALEHQTLVNLGMEQLAASTSGELGEIISKEKLAKAQSEARLKLIDQQIEQQKKLAQYYGISPEIITPETGQAVISFAKNLDQTQKSLVTLTTEAKKPKRSLEELSILAGKLGETINTIPDVVKKSGEAWNEFADSAHLALRISTVQDFKTAVDALDQDMESLSHRESLGNLLIGETKDSELTKINSAISRREDILKQIVDLGDTISVQTKTKYQRELEILEAKKKNLEAAKELKTVLDAKELTDSATLQSLQQVTTLESVILEKKIQQMKAEAAILKSRHRGKEAEALEKEIKLLQQKLQLTVKPEEARAMADVGIQAGIQALTASKDLLTSKQQQVLVEEKILELRKAQVDAMKEGSGKEAAKIQLAADSEQLARQKDAAPFQDASSALGSLQNLEGLSEMQSLTLSVGQTITDTFANAALAGESFTDFLTNNSQAFTDFSVTIANAASSMFQSISAGKIDSINLEIEAEKRRDGKSAESLEKIKRLEKKKIQEKKKADIASAGMSTATAIMRAMSEVPYPANFVVAGLAGAMGLMQIANINKAANGQIAALNDGAGKAASVTVGGNRSNAIDVSGAATAGELAFLTGGKGDFRPGRAAGGFASAGQSYTTGERGPEIVTPVTPSVVTPAGESTTSSSNNFNVSLNISTMDSESFASTAENNASAFWDAVEKEANARGLSLNNL